MEKSVGRMADTQIQSHATPLIFGCEKDQRCLLQIYLKGRVRVHNRNGWNRLKKTGIVLMYQDDIGCWLALDPRHPAKESLNDLLIEMTGEMGPTPIIPSALPPTTIKYDQALGHAYRPTFGVLVEMFSGREYVDTKLLHRLLPKYWPESINGSVDCLIESGLIVKNRDKKLRMAEGVPESLKPFITNTAEAFSKHDPRLNQQLVANTGRIKSFEIPDDGAPRLFATDIRLRNFMALAIHGPMLLRELRTIIGTPHLRTETERLAQFGRGAIIRLWETELGTAIMLDPDYPLYLPLRNLLMKMHEKYPLPAFVPRFEAPKAPASHEWVGDRHALFGSTIPTTILTSIGVHGWTFEALCVNVCTGHDRWNIKRSMQRLEAEGVIQGDRPRSPGFNTRVVTIATDFHAKAELEALLQAYVEQWPSIQKAVWSGFNALEPRGKAHLKNRGLWMYDQDGVKIDAATAMSQAKKKIKTSTVLHEAPEQIQLNRTEILKEYARLTKKLGYPPKTADLLGNNNWAFYNRIIAYFGSFVEFRKSAGVPLPRRPVKGKTADR